MTMDKSRQQFEGWFNGEYKTTMKNYDEPLVEFVMKQLFIVWQASRENLINNLEPVGYVNSIGIFALNRKLNSVIRPNKDDNSITLYRLDK
ncbi:hypothetical protein [Providencia rettgeri]|uniref:hypothetical protein n=1 Tax=Providencia rettgeri TaxID=587 RepID=UPI0018C5574B|nr:hypothetical protein [Providencia rettgeri]MBG5926095.1 hypothetical protein [Providencia rettgeri]